MPMTIGGAAKSSPTEGGQRKQPGQWQPWGIPGPFSLIWRGGRLVWQVGGPDLVVAVFIAGLLLQSAWSIVNDARRDLRDLREVLDK
jgi:hypothetical protein